MSDLDPDIWWSPKPGDPDADYTPPPIDEIRARLEAYKAAKGVKTTPLPRAAQRRTRRRPAPRRRLSAAQRKRQATLQLQITKARKLREPDVHPLRRVRYSKNMSQQTLSLLSGVSKAHIGALERNSDKVPRWSTAIALSRALKCSVQDIFPGLRP